MTEADLYGVPEFVISKVETENAGGGNIRILVYSKKFGVLIPQYTAIASAVDMLIACRDIQAFAEAIFKAREVEAVH